MYWLRLIEGLNLLKRIIREHLNNLCRRVTGTGQKIGTGSKSCALMVSVGRVLKRAMPPPVVPSTLKHVLVSTTAHRDVPDRFPLNKGRTAA